MTETAIKERPILFTGEMVRAILDGRKTQTRRVVKLKENDRMVGAPSRFACYLVAGDGPGVYGFESEDFEYPCPYGQPGDRLWVRETAWYDVTPMPSGETRCFFENYIDVTTDKRPGVHASPLPAEIQTAEMFRLSGLQVKRPSIHMPRWASRITLEVTAVRVERVQEISEADAIAEGIEAHDNDGVMYYGPLDKGHCDPRHEFHRLWDSINAKRGFGWAENPWVWVVEFERI